MRHNATEAAALGLLGLHSSFDTLSTVPLKAMGESAVNRLDDDEDTSDYINCICGFTYDDGFSIGATPAPAGAMRLASGSSTLSPRPIDRDPAVRTQKARQRAALDLDRQKRRVSNPGVDRRGRRPSAAAIDGGGQSKRRRRPSINVQPTGEDEHVDIDEPWSHSYVSIDKDIIPHNNTRDRLRRAAPQWRGVTALEGESSTATSPTTTPVLLTYDGFPSSSPIHLTPLTRSAFHPALSLSVDPSLRPPSYAVSRSIPSSSFITPFMSTIIPSTTYLSDPLNAYAHLSMPKSFVHLIGPPLDLALDARQTGNQSRFVRSGCRPNAVLRAVLCPRIKRSMSAQRVVDDGEPEDEDALTFGIFALRDLKAHEEVMLSWEWDDGSVIHHLPALINNPHIFPLHQYRQQMMSTLHTLSSTFATCSRGPMTRDCALALMVESVDSHTPPTLTPSPRYLHRGADVMWNIPAVARMASIVYDCRVNIFIKDVKSSNGTFINGERLSPEGVESEPFELKSDDIVEFGIDIVGEDNKTITHHKVAARVVCVLTEQEAQAAARAEAQAGPATYGVGVPPAAGAFSFAPSQPPNAPGQQRCPSLQQGLIGLGDRGRNMRAPGKSGLTFDHILSRL
ncbi:hypothetical protein IEO21_09824 [Rhodonia placenta]|uniref:FHA domain-containing protein n=1 Tax=Rhodonia placenta TaxID=104341 RepID=A0A8H7NTJ9_9APHY|nr:hypothetical protein IEO21_09824 [Postia placenta]